MKAVAREPARSEARMITARPKRIERRAKLPWRESCPKKSAVTEVSGVQVLEETPALAVGVAAISAIRETVKTRAAAAQSEGTTPATSFLFRTFRGYP
jgi:hypothetical protein